MENNIIKILHLEDVLTDVELIGLELKRAGLRFETLHVDTKSDYIHALKDYLPHIILSDHNLPFFNSIEALRILKESGLDTPFILISSAISEEFAVEIMKLGASDYILKDRPQRLPSAILTAMQNSSMKAERQLSEQSLIRSEANLRTVFENTDLSIIFFDADLRILSFNSNADNQSLNRYGKSLVPGRSVFDYYPQKDWHVILQALEKTKRKSAYTYDVSYELGKETLWYELKWNAVTNDEKAHIGVILTIKDITEKKKADLERQQITADLVRRNLNLEQFTYIVSHNLRLPVANIMALSNLMLEFGPDYAGNSEVLEALSTSVKKLDAVLIDLSQIIQHNNTVNERIEEVRFEQVIADITQSINAIIEKEAVCFECDFSQAEVMVTVKSYLHSILYNLITNSVKYKREYLPPVISISTAVRDNNLILIYKDNGKGIDMDKNGKDLFGLYKRFDHDVEGKGMGLFLVKTQVESLQGEIRVASKLHAGTEFTIQFPLTILGL